MIGYDSSEEFISTVVVRGTTSPEQDVVLAVVDWDHDGSVDFDRDNGRSWVLSLIGFGRRVV